MCQKYVDNKNGDRCNKVWTQCPAVHIGPNKSPSTLSCILDGCQVLERPFSPFINKHRRRTKLSDEFFLTADPHLHKFAKLTHSVGFTFGPA